MATITVTKGYAGSGGTGWTSGETVTPEKLNLAQTPSVAVADIETADLEDGAVTAGKLAGTLDLTGKTVTLPASSVGASPWRPTPWRQENQRRRGHGLKAIRSAERGGADLWVPRVGKF